MAVNPFNNVLTGLQQIDFDLIAWSNAVVANLQALSAQDTSGVNRVRVDFIDVALSTILAAINNPPRRHVSALTITNPVMGAASATIIASNVARQYLLITNPTAVPVFIHFGSPATVNDLVIGAGGFWSSGDNNDLIYDGQVTGITAGGAATLVVVAG